MKKIAIIGASYLQLPLVKKAKELGMEVHCFAWEEGAVCADYADFFCPISTIDKEKILEECKRKGIDGIVTELDNRRADLKKEDLKSMSDEMMAHTKVITDLLDQMLDIPKKKKAQ